MTQTLMDFMAKVSPPTHRSAPWPSNDTFGVTSPLAKAEARYQDRLDGLNQTISRLADGGRLIGVPLCPSACVPGDLADFILSLGTDPYQRWNIVLYADGATTARALGTIPYHPDYDHAVDAVMVTYLTGLQRSHARQRQANPHLSAMARAAVDRSYRDRLFTDCARIEGTLFGSRERQWQLHSDSDIAPASPPSAVISADMSAGNGAENRIA